MKSGLLIALLAFSSCVFADANSANRSSEKNESDKSIVDKLYCVQMRR